ncbi:MAG TPA: 2,3-bisphosphoglycerate-dependent phosphoglycerate mutase [Candidatus Saccharimonadales bacterium]|jgi:D-lactate dehydrogenase|nr:2,3-bisphosphoglycerate-dependent phosphoglycerate mutase [Candidatus Saccharimonadales bacterium]
MALILFYDASDLDKSQLDLALSGTDHHWEFVTDKIEESNINHDAEVISVFISSNVNREVIEAMPKLKLIACRSTGFNNVDLAAAEEHSVTVVNVPTYGENTVAEYAFTMLLALMRKLPDVLKADSGQFSANNLMGRDLQGKVFGVVGTGHIGQKALKIANGFSMQCLGYDSFQKPELQDEYHFKYVELDDLLAQADIVSIHLPYLPSTHHIMNRERLEKMKPDAILINTARGELVDTEALTELLDQGRIGGACIDVIEGESMMIYHEEMVLLRSDTLPEETLRHSVQISALEKMPNVIISPHNAFNTVEAIKRINDMTAKNIIDYWFGSTPNKVAPEKKPVGKLVVVRHTESMSNALGKWTGLTDVHLSENGFKEAAMLGQAFKKLDIPIDKAYCSEQIRTRETLEGMLDAAQQFGVDIEIQAAMNERDYGEYTGKNKWEIKDSVGEEAFNNIRRGWDVAIPGGETLKMVYARVTPFYTKTVLPLLLAGNNVLIVASGNSLRALKKYLESISDEDISNVEMPFGQIIVYSITSDGLKASSEETQIDITPPNA